ncbi:ferritin-like domain-containing protein, partial [Sphingomonas sp.]|uniref:ferritin-like domain-containing protein n=1 Tax=Sphingomonas sp. TaxID=28214 RepID=UPI002D804919
PVIAQYAREIAADEIAHITFLRNALGGVAAAQPTINLSGSATVTAPGIAAVGAFTAAARAAGVVGPNEIFDPFANDINFLIGSYLLTDVGVSAYRGSARLLQANKVFLEASAGILATEAYHDGVIRASIYARGIAVTPPLINNQTVFQVVQKISDSRDVLDGPLDLDQGIGDATTANLVPTDANGLTLGRTAPQVLNVVYQSLQPVTGGGFFPAGVNGAIRTSSNGGA